MWIIRRETEEDARIDYFHRDSDFYYPVEVGNGESIENNDNKFEMCGYDTSLAWMNEKLMTCLFAN